MSYGSETAPLHAGMLSMHFGPFWSLTHFLYNEELVCQHTELRNWTKTVRSAAQRESSTAFPERRPFMLPHSSTSILMKDMASSKHAVFSPTYNKTHSFSKFHMISKPKPTEFTVKLNFSVLILLRCQTFFGFLAVLALWRSIYLGWWDEGQLLWELGGCLVHPS